jgi:opacity protein-like surface antigen
MEGIMPRLNWAASASLLVIVLSASTARAQWFEESSPWVPYISGTVQASSIDMDTGGLNTAGPHVNFSNDVDDTYALGGALGVSQDHGRFRTRGEIEGMWYDDNEDLRTGSFPGPPGPAAFFYNTNVDSQWSVMANVWADLYINEYAAWYLGGGAGGAGGRLETNDTVVAGSSSDQDFAYQVGTGMLINVSDNAELDLGYRFVDLGELETNISQIAGGIPAGKFKADREAHNFAVTLRYYLYE